VKTSNKKNKIYIKFRNGNKIVETYVDTHEERTNLYELIKEEVFGKTDKRKIGFNVDDEDDED
jgi:hypothetical protein